MAGLGSAELGLASQSLDGRQWGGSCRRSLFSMGGGERWREEGQGGTGKVFEEQKQWPILCHPAWLQR